MGYINKVKFWPNERLDLPDLDKLQDNVYSYLGVQNQGHLASISHVISGCVTQNDGGLNIRVVVKDSVILNTTSVAVGVEGLLWVGTGDNSIDADLTATLTNNATSYVEIEVYPEDGASDTRAFWDPTANTGTGDEYNQVVNTCVSSKTRLRVNTTGFTGNVNYIPISTVVTAGGTIVTIFDSRSLFYRLNSDYAWGSGRTIPANTSFAGADKSIPVMKDWMDAVMTTLKEIKGVEWYETSSSVNTTNLFYDLALTVITGNGRVDHSNTTAGLLTYPALKLKPFSTSVTYTIPAGSQTLADGEILYIDINEGGNRGVTGNRTLNKISRSLLTYDGDVYWIAYRDDNGGNPSIFFRNVGLIQQGESQIVGEEGEKDFIVDRNTTLIEGDPWTFDVTGGTVTLGSDAYFSVPGLQKERNTILAQTITGMNADGKVAYVDINRDAGANANLTVTVTTIGAFQNAQNRFILLQRVGNIVNVFGGQVLPIGYIYDESQFQASALNFNNSITLPLDSRNADAIRYYRVGGGDLQFYINGVLQQRDKVLKAGLFLGGTYSYVSGTGVVTVPNTHNLASVMTNDVFTDGAGNDFRVLGGVVNSGATRSFNIATGQTVNVASDGGIYRQDYAESGTLGGFSNSIILKKNTPAQANFNYIIHPIERVVKGGSGGGGGGSTSLQQAYNNGATITTLTGTPIVINGPASEKLLDIQGDITVTGVIDPKGITLTPQTVNPAPGQNTIWIKTTGELMISNDITSSETEIFTNPTTPVTYTNNTGATISKGRAVIKTSVSTIATANQTSFQNAAVIGITKTDIIDNGTGEVYRNGSFIPGAIFANDDFIEGTLPTEGTWIYLGNDFGKLTITAPLSGSNLASIVLGIWDNGGLNFSVVPWGIA